MTGFASGTGTSLVNAWSDGDESGTIGISVSWSIGVHSREVDGRYLVAEQEVGQVILGITVLGKEHDRGCGQVEEGNALRYGGESGTIRFSVVRGITRGSRHGWEGYLGVEKGTGDVRGRLV